MNKPMNQPIVSFKNLHIQLDHQGKQTPLVKGISLDIHAGEIVGLVGESGSGKSLSALSILQLLPDNMHYPSGELWVDGLNVLTATRKQLQSLRGQTVGCVFQEPMTSLNPLHTIEKQLAESLYLHKGWGIKQARPAILENLKRVELRDPEQKLNAYPHQLSGGERQRVMIAMALINEPKLLIADEPTTALDVTVQAQILALIKRLQRETNMAVLFISHDLGVVKRLASRVAVMKNGQLVEQNETAALFNDPQHEYTQRLIAAEPSGRPELTTDEPNVVLQGKDIKVWFPIQKGLFRRTVDHIKAVDGIDLQVKAGQTLGIVGESGSGKSTLAKALLGLQDFTGEALFKGQSLTVLTTQQWQPLRRKIQVVFQDPYGSLSPRMSVGQIIAEGLEINKMGTHEEQTQKVIETMNTVGLNPDMRSRYPNEFSGGQRQRIAIARALIMNPELIVLDEPTSSLDRTVQSQIIELLQKLQREKGMSYVFISHDLKVVKVLAHDVLVMKSGKMIEHGRHVFDSPQHPYTKTLVDTAFA